MSTLTPTKQPACLTQANYAFLQEYVERISGIVVAPGKDYFFEARLGPIAQTQNVPDLNDLCALLRGTSRLLIRLTRRDARTISRALAPVVR